MWIPLRIIHIQKEQDSNKPTNSDEGLEISVIAATLRLSSSAGLKVSAFFLFSSVLTQH